MKKEKLIRLMPKVLSIFVCLIVGLTFAGKLFSVSVGENIIEFNLIDLIKGEYTGKPASVFFIFLYIILPISAGFLLFFGKNKQNFLYISMLILLVCGLVSIISKNVLSEAIYRHIRAVYDKKVPCEIDEVYFISYIPIVGYMISFCLVLSLAIEDIKFTTRDITEIGIFVAGALILNFIKLFPLSSGGSVNLQMLPLYLLVLRHGPVKGFIGCGIIYGLLSCIIDGYGFATFPFDYLLAFGGASVLGFFSKNILNHDGYNVEGVLYLLFSGLLATIIRFIAGTISSMVVYSYNLEAALIYNVGYVFISSGLSLALIIALYVPILKVNKLYPAKQA